MDRPSGTVAFLFTDIESSMRLWSTDAASMAASLEVHDGVVSAEIEAAGGHVFTRAGDSFAAAFSTADAAIEAARRCQRRLADLEWPGPLLAVRMGLHVGEAQLRDDDYFGPTVNLAARVADSAHGDQIVATASFVEHTADPGSTQPLGAFLLRGVDEPVEIHQVGAGDFPQLRADAAASDIVQFDNFAIDQAARTLRHGDETIHMEPQVLDVLVYLVDNRDRLVSREELLDEVWGDQFVSISALTTRIKQARQALGDDGRTQRYIRNERGRGYQFVGEIRAGSPTMPDRASTPQTRRTDPTGTSIFGRHDDRLAVDAMVATSPITTVVGPGGVGKTTLITALLQQWQEQGRQAVVVYLDRVREDDAIGLAVTTTLGLSGGTAEDHVAACADWLGATGQVLVLDNCEHLLGPVRSFVSELVRIAPDVRVLTTSRHRLGLDSESIHRLLPFVVPSDEEAAQGGNWACLDIFAAAAQRAGGMVVSDEDYPQVLDICRRLDGLPLAIELAASRLSTLGLHDLLDGLDDRLDWVRSRSVDAGDRQRSLRSTVEWSFRFLDADSQRFVAALSLFPAGLTLADATALAGELGIEGELDELVARLVDASVLTPRRQQSHARFAMLETIRQYGLDTLGADPAERATVEDHLIRHALELSDAERGYWTGDRDPRQRSLARLHDEIPNLRAAREVMLQRADSEGLIQLAVGLCAFTEEACLAELWSWHDTTHLLDDPSGDEMRAAVLLLDATAARNRGEIDACAEAAAAAAELSDDRWIKGRALHTGAMASLFRGDPFSAGDLWLASDEQLGGCRGRLFSAMAAAFAGDLDLAASRLRECDVTEQSRVPVDLFTNLHLVRGEVARVAETGDARAEFEEAVAIARRHGLMFSLGISQVPLVAILDAEGDAAAAAAGYHELIELFLRSGTWTQVWITLRNAARLLSGSAPETAMLICLVAADDPGAPALDEASQAEVDERHAAIESEIGADDVARVKRRASLASRVDVVREVVAALEQVA